MSDKGENKVIQLRGIERAGSDLNMQDGGLNEMVGLIHRDGSLIPYSPTDSGLNKQKDIVFARVHHTSTGDNLIVVRKESLVAGGSDVYTNVYYSDYHTFMERKGYCSEELIDVDVEVEYTQHKKRTIKDVVFIGNRMDISTEENGIEHWLWHNGKYERTGVDDAYTNGDGRPSLPTVDFKVDRGIYNGSRVIESVRFVKVDDNIKEAQNSADRKTVYQQEDKDAAYNYVKNQDGIVTDMMRVRFAVREMGGIDGYFLVCAAYHISSSGSSNGKYILACPVMLMGAPEIMNKDGSFETKDGNYIQAGSRTWMLDLLDYTSRKKTYADDESFVDEGGQDWCFEYLYNLTDTDSREVEDLGPNENVEVIEEQNLCFLRDGYKFERDSYIESYKANDALLVQSSRVPIWQPALYGQKYYLYNHMTNAAFDDKNANAKGVRITHGSGNHLSFKVNGSVPEEYKDEIDNLCIFISPIVSHYEVGSGENMLVDCSYENVNNKYEALFFDELKCHGNYKMEKSAVGASFMPKFKSDEGIREKIRNCDGLYEVASYDINQLKEDWVMVDLSGKIENDKILKHTDEMIKLSDLMPFQAIGGNIFDYNERLHIYNFTESNVFKCGYSCLPYKGGSGQYPEEISKEKIEYQIEIKDKDNSLIVQRFESYSETLNPFLSYVQPQTKEITIAKRYKRNGKLYAGSKSFTPITSFLSLIGGYLKPSLYPIKIVCPEVDSRTYDSIFREQQLQPESQTYGKNEIIVSGVGDLLFDPSSSVKVGKGEIVGLARLSIGLSQDNFGKYPLIVFSTDGVYTLEVDTSGETAYSSSSALSRQICTNKNGICELDGMVLFPTEAGLCIIQGQQNEIVCRQVIGKPRNLPSDENGLKVYKNAVSDERLVEVEEDLLLGDFLTYINSKSTHIRYVQPLNSVVIYNSHLSYSYLVELSEWKTTKLDLCILFDDRNYPKPTFWLKPENYDELFVEYDGEYSDYEAILAGMDVEQMLRDSVLADLEAAVEDSITVAQNSVASCETTMAKLEATLARYKQGEDLDDLERNGITLQDYEMYVTVSLVSMRREMAGLRERAQRSLLLRDIDLTSEVNAEEEELLTEFGLATVSQTISNMSEKEREKKLQELALAEQKHRIGVANHIMLAEALNSGKLSIRYSDGKWYNGNREISTDALKSIGLEVATEPVDGLTYRINVLDLNYQAIRFDYEQGKDSTECMFQTRPIKLDSRDMKTSYRVVLRGVFDKQDEQFDITYSGELKSLRVIDSAKLQAYCNGESKTLSCGWLTGFKKIKNPITKEEDQVEYEYWGWKDEQGNVVNLYQIGLEQIATEREEHSATIKENLHYAGLYVFGSLDAEHWALIGGKEKLLSNNRFHDLGCDTHRVSVKYLMVVFVGNLSMESHIDLLEISSREKWK